MKRKPWRKLYALQPGSSFARLPQSVRGYAYHLLTLADDNGVLCPIADGERPAAVVAHVHGCDARSRKWAHNSMARLVKDGFVKIETGLLIIPNFERFQGGPKGRQKAIEQASDVSYPSPKVGLSLSYPLPKVGLSLSNPDAMVSGSPQNHSTHQTTRIKIREDKIREEKRIKVSTKPMSSLDSTTAAKKPGWRIVFEHWQSVLKPRAKLDKKRRDKIEARLKDGFTVEQLKRVVDEAKVAPFHSGQNDAGRTYWEPATIFRDAAQVEAFLEGRHRKKLTSRNPADREADELLANLERQKESGRWNRN